MRAVLSCGLFVLAIGVSFPAAAWWEYAKWGLNVDQVVKASKGLAEPCSPTIRACAPAFADYRPSLHVPHFPIAGYDSTVHFKIDAPGGLSATYLIFNGANFARLSEALASVYGTPVEVINQWPARRAWRDGTKGTLVKIWNFPDSDKIVIEYKPAMKGL